MNFLGASLLGLPPQNLEYPKKVPKSNFYLLRAARSQDDGKGLIRENSPSRLQNVSQTYFCAIRREPRVQNQQTIILKGQNG